MNWVSTVVFVCCSSMLCAQVQVTASGSLTITANPELLPPSSVTHSVTGPVNFVSAGVGAATLTLGAVSELTLSPVAPPFGCGFCFSVVAGDVVVSYSSPTPLAGVLRLTSLPVCWVNPSSVDVENDGVLEIYGTSACTVDVPVVLSPDAIDVRLLGQPVNFSGASATCNQIQRVEFLPQPTAMTTLPPACGPMLGGTLTDTATTGRNLRVHIANTNGQLGVLQVGTATPPVPGACGPATLPDAAVILVPGPNGIEFDVPVAVSLTGMFTLQFVDVTLSPFVIDWSNGLLLSV